MNVTQAKSCARSADWRFLLARASGRAFEHLVLVGGSPALESSILDLGVARRVSRAPRPGDRADALIVLAGATESLSTLASCLVRGGVLYWEIDRRSPRQFALTPARALERVRQHGLKPTGTYWVKPGFPDRQMYLPLGARGAFRWYLDTLYRSPTRGRSVLKSALRALAAGCDGLATFAPCYAMTAVRGIERPSALVERACLDGVWTSATPPQPVLLANGDAEWNRIVLLLFESNAPVPTTAIKLPRTPVFNPQIEWEHDLLGELGADLAPPLRGSIPTSTVFRWNDLAVSAETCVTGSSLSTRTGLHANGVLEDLHLTTKWLATFHRQTTIDRVSARKWVTQRLVNGMCSDYAATFGLTAAEKQLFAMLSDRLDVADAHVLPIVWQHADFGPWNVYRDQDDVSVIDWEVARRGPALTDLLYFVTHWSAARATCATDAEHLDHFASLFCGGIPRGMLTHAIHAEIGEYMRRVDVPSSLFAFLLLYTFLEQALDCARRLATIQDMAAASRARNRYVGYVGVLARHADRLFARGSITDGV